MNFIRQKSKDMKKLLFISMFIVTLALLSCNKTSSYKNKLNVHHEDLEPKELEIKHYNKELFSLDTADFANGLKSIQDDYMVFLAGDLDDADGAVNRLYEHVG